MKCQNCKLVLHVFRPSIKQIHIKKPRDKENQQAMIDSRSPSSDVMMNSRLFVCLSGWAWKSNELGIFVAHCSEVRCFLLLCLFKEYPWEQFSPFSQFWRFTSEPVHLFSTESDCLSRFTVDSLTLVAPDQRGT